MADAAFERVHAWCTQVIDRFIESMANAGQRDLLSRRLCSLENPVHPAVAPPPAVRVGFDQPDVAAIIAATVVGQTIAAIDPMQTVIDTPDGYSWGLASARAEARLPEGLAFDLGVLVSSR